jgi:transcriptional regulator with GAF, ATPase, and Fis domain
MDEDLQGSDSERLEDIERSHIIRVLEKTDWIVEGKQGAASILGLNPATLRFRMKKLGIRKPRRST